MKTLDFFDRRHKKRLQRVLTEYLKHKGYKADIFKFTIRLYKQPDHRIAGFNIAVQRGEYLGKTCIYYSLICFRT